MNVWNSTINDSLQYKIEGNNKFDPSAVELTHNDCLKQKIVGHITIHLSKAFYRFLNCLTVTHQRWSLVNE